MVVSVRDFLYLDVERLNDYMASVEGGAIQSMRSATRREVHTEPENINPGFDAQEPEQRKLDEYSEERVLAVADRHRFTKYYETIKSDLPVYDEFTPIDLAEVERGSLIETIRSFERSPLSEMIDSLLEVVELMRRMGADDQRQQAAEMAGMLAVLMRESDEGDKSYPMLAEGPDSSPKTLFIAQRRSIIRGLDEFEGEMTMIGKITKIVPAGAAVDLFDLLRIFPRSFRRMKGTSAQQSPRDAIIGMFSTWPDAMGGPLGPEALRVEGPAIVVSPLAAFD